MARNGSGVYAPPATDYPAVASTLIESAKYNNVISDIATAITGSIAADGQTTITANLPMNSKKLTGLASGSARTDSSTLGQVQDGTVNWVDGGGTADAITATYSPVITALIDGQICFVRATAANATTTPTFAPNGLTARTIVMQGGVALVAGSIGGDGHELILRYDLANTRWELLNPKPVEKAALSGATFTGLVNLAKGADIASAATVNLTTATGNLVHITGTTPTSAVTMTSGQWMLCIADAAWPLTYHATTNKISGGADYTLTAGDMVLYNYDGTTVRGHIIKADGTAVVDVGITLGTAVAATSGTSIDFTGIPATAKRVTLVLAGVSTNGTSPFIVQIGDAGGIEATGYVSGAGSRTAEGASTIGFILNQVGVASSTYTAVIPITLFDTNSWATSGALNRVSDGFAQTFGGQKTLSETLDRVRLTTVNGTDTFDAGTVNITYES